MGRREPASSRRGGIKSATKSVCDPHDFRERPRAGRDAAPRRSAMSSRSAARGRSFAVDGERYRRRSGDPLSVGKLLAIESGRSFIVGLIYAAESSPNKPNTMLASVELQGEIRPAADGGKATFDRGIRTYPPIGAAAHEMDTSELETVYDYKGAQTITIGTLSQDESIDATVRVQDLLQKHFAVLGTTGCGKSSAVVLLLDRILKATEATRILLIDPHNEYAAAFQDEAEVVSPRYAEPAVLAVQFRGARRRHLPPAPGRQRGGRSPCRPHPARQGALRARHRRGPSLIRRDIEDSGYTVEFAGSLPHPRRACDDRRTARQARRQGRPPVAPAAHGRASSRSCTTRATSSCSRAARSKTRWPIS